MAITSPKSLGKMYTITQENKQLTTHTMNIKEKIRFFESREKRLIKKAKRYAKVGQIDSARDTMSMAAGLRSTIGHLKNK